jgi:hypothetical protein
MPRAERPVAPDAIFRSRLRYPRAIVTCGYDVGFDAFVFHFEGELRHWSADWQGTAVLAVPRDDVKGH